MDQKLQVDRGFSVKAAEYDALSRLDAITIWLRSRVRTLVEASLPPGGSILEINAGSGIDAAYFASRGYRVHATDVAAGMLEATAEKASRPESGGRLTWEARDFRDLGGVEGAPYDLVFSNLGGLNCTPDLEAVARQLPVVLRPGGHVVWVLMPPLCPWELVQALRGHLGTATRRLKRGGTVANVEGASVQTWYHGAGSVRKALGPAFTDVQVRSFCLFAPPSFFQGFTTRHPAVTRRLMQADDALGRLWPLNRAGDFIAVTARYSPSTHNPGGGTKS
jgi:ubiquinone/menaquinone biosynthesis C-methylase UbiE